MGITKGGGGQWVPNHSTAFTISEPPHPYMKSSHNAQQGTRLHSNHQKRHNSHRQHPLPGVAGTHVGLDKGLMGYKGQRSAAQRSGVRGQGAGVREMRVREMRVRAECLSYCSQLQRSAAPAPDPLPAHTDFTFYRSQTVKCGGCSPHNYKRCGKFRHPQSPGFWSPEKWRKWGKWGQWGKGGGDGGGMGGHGGKWGGMGSHQQSSMENVGTTSRARETWGEMGRNTHS